METKLEKRIKQVVVVIVVAFIFVMCHSCCTTKYVEVPKVHTEYIVRTDSTLIRDTVLQKDSIRIYTQGDTVYTYKYKDKYIVKYLNKYVTDTLLIRDTIPQIIYKTKEVKIYPSLMEKLKAGLLFLLVCVGFGWAIKKLFS